MKSPITTHVLDTSLGRPAVGVAVTLFRMSISGATEQVGIGTTNQDGRVLDLVAEDLPPGIYHLAFDTAGYFGLLGTATFYPRVDITFEIKNPGEHYHVPLLLSPFGYSTYRGS